MKAAIEVNATPPPTAQTSLRRRQDASAERMCLHGKWQTSDRRYRSEDRSAANGANKFAMAARR